MIIVRLMGGLGNQLFQYSAGLAVARRLGAELKVDIEYFEKDRGRRYGLPDLSVNAKRATRTEIHRLKKWKQSTVDRGVRRLLGVGLPAPRTYCEEADLAYTGALESVADDVYLDGYWQAFHYVACVEHDLRVQVGLAGTIPGKCIDMATEMANCESVSLHLRRGDYISNPRLAGVYVQCEETYYRTALESVRSEEPQAEVYIFTDDPVWARDSWVKTLGGTIVTEGAEAGPAGDLWLMSKCKHHIISNSTYAWWGAWLGSQSGSKVIAPETWFKRLPRAETWLYPQSWIRMSPR